MYISWYGEGCFKIDLKSENEEITILTEPFDLSKTGLKVPRSWTADIVVQRADALAHSIKTRAGQQPFFISGAGEYEVKGVVIYAIPLTGQAGEREIISRIEAERIILVYGSFLTHVPDETELQKIEGLDVLIVPVGGHGTLDTKSAAALVSKLQPRIVIPMMYNIPGLQVARDSVDQFIKLLGATVERPAKFKLTRKDLPADEMKIIVLETV